MRHAAIADLKVSGSPCSPSEWEHILESVLLERQILDDIQLTAALRSERVQITVRKKAQGITVSACQSQALLAPATTDEDGSLVADHWRTAWPAGV